MSVCWCLCTICFSLTGLTSFKGVGLWEGTFQTKKFKVCSFFSFTEETLSLSRTKWHLLKKIHLQVIMIGGSSVVWTVACEVGGQKLKRLSFLLSSTCKQYWTDCAKNTKLALQQLNILTLLLELKWKSNLWHLQFWDELIVKICWKGSKHL